MSTSVILSSCDPLNNPGLVSEVLMRKKEMEVQANLKNIVILDCNKEAFYKKVKPASV